MNQKILDPCCGSRMFYFDRNNSNVVFGHISGKRANTHWICFMKEKEEG